MNSITNLCRLFRIAILFFLVSNFPVSAQNVQYQFSHLDITNGLSHNQVTAIFKDSKGFMWFGTMAGLNRFDGYKFKVFKHNPKDSTSISDDFIESIQEGPENKLWIINRFGLNIYDPRTEKFSTNSSDLLDRIQVSPQDLWVIERDRRNNFLFVNANLGIKIYDEKSRRIKHLVNSTKDKGSIYCNSVSDIGIDSKGDYWIVYTNGVIDKVSAVTLKVVNRYPMLSRPGTSARFSLKIDQQDDIWVYNSGSDVGLYYFNPRSRLLKHFNKNSGQISLNSNIISNLIQDSRGLIWVATDHGGINILDKKDFSIRHLVHREDDKKSVGQNSIISMFKDDSGIIWIGTFKRGISYYHDNIIKFPLIRHHVSDPNSLPYEDVNRFVEDAKGNLWIGTNGGGLIYYDRLNNRFKQYRHIPGKNSLSNDVVVSLCIDHEQKLWIGTYFGGLDCFDGSRFKNYRNNPSDSQSLSDDRVWEIFEDSRNNLWIGTLTGGINRFDRKKGIFHHYRNSLKSAYTSSIFEDKGGNLWFGSSNGVDVLLKKTGRFKNLSHNNSKPNSLIHDNVSNMLLDRRGWVWMATREGLSMLNPITGKFRNFTKDDGMPDNTVSDIQEGAEHDLWLSTSNGLSNLILSPKSNGDFDFSFRNYDENDGLQGLEFNESASLRTKKGELIFGGPNGFNIFNPERIRSPKVDPLLVLTDFQVFNKSLKPGEKINGHSILDASITESKSVTLDYDENVFSIEFAALNFFNAHKVKLQYMLQGFDKEWLNADSKVRKATYTNLDPGSYTFKVRASDEDGSFGGKGLSFKVFILPPFWQTPLAYFFYILSVIAILYTLRKRGINKIKTQFAIEQERQEARRMHELDMMKIKFFTNVSHEFRTPLALILAPVEKMLKQTADNENLQQIQMINRNARRLLNLVNQLLDFRKLETQELKLHTRVGDIIKFIKEISYSFTDVAEKKNIGFVFDSECDALETQFDADKIERILFNLLSNSFKFTMEGGHVSVLVNVLNDQHLVNRCLEIKVIDTGIGIPKEKRERVFERFFQNDVPGSMVNQGSGIGLSITKEFVKLHGGEITVESEPGEGSCFIVRLPVGKYELETNQPTVNTNLSKLADQRPPGKKLTVLLVEDNDDFRFYLKDNLKEWFHIIEASNGKEGWQKALSLHPNLVVSDISMPEMDGIALCRKIKSDSRTTHMPVVLLTALTGEEQQLKGLETGATDYMTKPFNFEILLSKIRNILLQQESMRKTYQKQVEVKPSQVDAVSPDELFIQKALQVIEKNISNPDFSVEELSSEMFMSRVTLYKKMLAITGKTPVEFIRSVRIKRAAQLLEKGHLTISQISYKVGFKSQKYFVKSFKAEYNMIPSAYQEEHKLQAN